MAALLAAVAFSPPAWAQDAAPTDDGREADLLEQLREAETPYAAGLVMAELRGMWSRSGSASLDLLVKRGRDAIEAGDPEAAIEHFSAAVDHGPGFAGGYAGRAIAYYLTGRIGPALDDLRQALALNPNDLESLQGAAALLEELGRPEDALEVWRTIADMNPQSEEAAQAVDRLALSLEGTAL